MWSPGPETGAWTFESDGGDEEGADSRWGQDAPWDSGYSEATAGAEQGEQGWYEPQDGHWEDQQAVAGPSGWYSEGFYPDEYDTGYERSHQDALAAYQEGYGTSAVPQVWDEADSAVQGGGTVRASGPWPELVMITAVAVIIAAVILAVTGANRTNVSNSQPPLPTAASSRVPGGATAPDHRRAPSTASKVPSTATPSSAAPTSAAPSSTTTASPVGAAALRVTVGVEQSLIKSWLHTDPGGVGLDTKDVAGTVPQQVFYAKQPGAPPVYWAVVAFQPSATVLAEQSTAAGQFKLAQFQNSDYVFDWKAGPYWTELGYVATGACPGTYVPTAVLSAWGLCGLGPSSGA